MSNDNRRLFLLLKDSDNVVCNGCGTQQIANLKTMDVDPKHYIKTFICLRCRQANIEIFWYADEIKRSGQFTSKSFRFKTIYRYPAAKSNFAIPDNCPDAIKEDYQEAARLLNVSARASAAFSRRCLEGILTAQGYTQNQLVQKIEALLKEEDPRKVLPYYISKNVDAVRGFGNFSAHPIVNKATAEITDVQPGEAEWCLQIIQELLDHYYTRPAEERAKIDQINEKLIAAGKPPIKVPKETE